MQQVFLQINSQLQNDGLNNLPLKIQILPPSPVMGRDGRTFTYNPQELVNAFIADKKDVLIDIEHASEIKKNTGELVQAVGWVKNLTVENNSIYGEVDWVENDGTYAIKNKSIRHISPVLKVDNFNNVKQLVSIGLTQRPNLDLPALNSMQSENMQNDNMQNNNQDNIKGATMNNNILTALGLPPSGTEDAILQAIYDLKKADSTALNNQLTEANKKIETLTIELNTQKEKEVEILKQASINKALTEGKILPFQVETFKVALNSMQAIEAFNTNMQGAQKIELNAQSINQPKMPEVDEINEFGISKGKIEETKRKIFNLN